MKKITIKVRAATGSDDVKKLLSLAAEVFPEADVDLLQCDDPALSIVVREVTEQVTRAPVMTIDPYGYDTRQRNGD